MKRIEGHSNLYKNGAGAVVNTDYSAFVRAKERKAEKNKVNNLEERLNKIESMLERLLSHVDTSK